MYAIIRAGGKQSKVREGDVIDVERIKLAGESVTFTPLLVVGDDGTVISDRDALEKATVTAEVIGEHRGDKIEVFKYKPKTGYRRRQGHRQTYTTLRVTSIGTGAPKRKPRAKSAKPAEPAEPVTEAPEEPAADATETSEES